MTLLAMLDLSAAFDTVNHQILLRKLTANGIGGSAINWFKCYLAERSQSVVVNGALSKMVPLETGVPQGSVLGPLLFALYVNDVTTVIRRFDGVEHLMYADDLQVFIRAHPDDAGNALRILEDCICEVKRWFDEHYLTVNQTKTEFMVFGTHHVLKKVPPLTLKFGEATIEPSDCVRNLGVWLDPQLKLNRHVAKVTQLSYVSLRMNPNASGLQIVLLPSLSSGSVTY